VTRKLFASLNVSTVAEARLLNATRFEWPAEYMNDLAVAPYFSGYFDDSYVIPPEGIESLWRKGSINPVEMIIGANSKDGTAGFYGTAPTLGLVSPDKKQTTPAIYRSKMKAAWGSQASEVLAAYPATSFQTVQHAFIQADADAFVICPSIAVSDYAVAGGTRVWHYEFSHFQASHRPDGFGCDNGVELDLVPARPTAQNRGWATHGAETHYVFGTTVGPDGLGPPHNLTHCPFTPDEGMLSATMMGYWASFLHHGDPNQACRGLQGQPCPHWPGWGDAKATQALRARVGGGIRTVAGMHTAGCRFWAGLYRQP